ncbi:MAG: ParB N-terminal domain-containing protein [Lamprobacter sp.]|uniref:ParB/RepB/Spo0J family partition protein n=1 Tax=Lamprobacter sp. TaxID=3100796 RepID=UPI002B258EE9|nr:ParB N-terminal domain-containing protein [Lamprobacter sp.]MEA3642386.1 ParB N-terminal domain-containing protein [Lamprobacter sp.]
MSTPKKFRFGSTPVTEAIGDVVRRGQSGKGELHYDRVDLDRIEPDPENPRQLQLTEDEFARLSDPDWVHSARALDEVDQRTRLLLRLRDLADSMIENDVLEPIRVFRHGSLYRVAYGERRYWGARLANLKNIPARISDQRPANVRTLQLVENLHRDDLDLAARMRNVIAVLGELEAEGEATTERFGHLVGMGERNARRYCRVAMGPQDVLDAVLNERVVRDLAVAASVASIVDDSRRLAVLANLRSGMSLADALAAVERAVESPKKQSRGRPATKVTLGATTNAAVVREIMQRVLGDEALPDLEWDDYRSVSKAWKAFLAELERSL